MSIEIDGTLAAEKNSESAQVFPVGFVYTVLPGKLNPVQMGLAGTWTNISSQFAGLFEGIEGGDRLAFGGGVQPDQMQLITGEAGGIRQWADGYESGCLDWGPNYNTQKADSGTNAATRKIIFDSSNSPGARTGDKTYPENITVQKWERTA